VGKWVTKCGEKDVLLLRLEAKLRYERLSREKGSYGERRVAK